MIHTRLAGRLVLVGCGSIGQGILPLLRRHIGLVPDRITIFSADDDGRAAAAAAGIGDFRVHPLTPGNHRALLAPLLGPEGFLLNLSCDVSTADLLALCHETGTPYLDTCIEPWPGLYRDGHRDPGERTNHALREAALAVGRRPGRYRPTCVLTHGVNPGLVSHFTKRALLRMAGEQGLPTLAPADGAGWARLARTLRVRALHIAERDFQSGPQPRQPGEFVNTWSVEALLAEGSQPAELGWGSHERQLPRGARSPTGGSQASIYLERPGMSVRVRSWTPLAGPYHGRLITHAESISLADHLSLYEDGALAWRPTVHYAYRPCDAALLSIDEHIEHGYLAPARQRLLREELTGGIDELGVLVCGNPRGVYWYGSRLALAEARALAPGNNATTLQTAAGALAGMVWALRNPGRGVVEPEAMDPEQVLAVAEPYLGPMVGTWGDWHPLQGRGRLFAEEVVADDPWQFANVLVD